MAHEAARALLAEKLKDLQKRLEALTFQIGETKREVRELEQGKESLLQVTRETASALSVLGGPIPEWTDNPELIAFWDEIKDA